jgi:glycosyltransferase involved in cell wall biosynthesis
MIDAVRIRGPFRGPTGHDRHVRGFARALDALGIGVQLVDLPQWSPARLPRELRDPWCEARTRPLPVAVVLHCCLPTQVHPTQGAADVNLTMFEATPIPAAWAEASTRVARVVVPTASSAHAWAAGGVAAQRVAVCPLGIDPAAYRTSPAGAVEAVQRGHGDIWARRTRFLNVADVNPRKNLAGLLRMWLRATTAHDDAALILKPGFYAPGARPRFAALLADAQAQTGIAAWRAAPIHVIDRLLPDAAMPALFAAATHYVSLSFGEGWDLPMVEAGAAGLGLIAPAHSAYLAYLDPSCATLIPATPVAAGPRAGPALAPLFAAASWWRPDEAAAAAAIRRAIDGGDGDVSSPRERILRELTWEQAARRLLEILTETVRR